LDDLAQLAKKKGILLYEDAGSGALLDLAGHGLIDEPVIGRSLSGGADLVTFSGDKLLGGAQAGIIVGRKNLVEQMRKHPLYRALRVSKLIYAALESTVDSYLRGDAGETVPVLRMLMMREDELADRTRDLEEKLQARIDSAGAVRMEMIPGESVVGGGSAPDTHPATLLLSISHRSMSPAEVERRLRMAPIPVIVRIENDRVLIDLRTVAEREVDRLVDMLAAVLQ
jgi:L-seryl-tRNA(Ser) seleniumtransferase